MYKIKTLIVDDERLARRRIRRFLLDEPDVEIVGECVNVTQARQVLSSTAVDLVFLDIQMPNGDGFGLLNDGGSRRPPFIVFITAYEQYAVRAFEVQAQDYLLKPVDQLRFKDAVGKARRAMVALTPIAEHPVSSSHGSLPAVLVRSSGRISLLRPEAIDWVETAGNYVRLHAGGETYFLRQTMAAVEANLTGPGFIRIHRSTLVNVERISEFQQLFNGDFSVVLKDGTQLRMSRTYRERVKDLLGNSI